MNTESLFINRWHKNVPGQKYKRSFTWLGIESGSLHAKQSAACYKPGKYCQIVQVCCIPTSCDFILLHVEIRTQISGSPRVKKIKPDELLNS